MNVALYASILVSFASWVTVHVALCWQLGRQKPWKGCVALLLPPLAPLWATRPSRLWLAWLACLALYGATLFAGSL